MGTRRCFTPRGSGGITSTRSANFQIAALSSTVTGMNVFEVHRRLHDKFAISGGIPNVLLSHGKPDEVRDFSLARAR